MAAKKVSPGQARRERGEKPVYDSYGRLSRVPETGELEKIEDQWSDNQIVIDRLSGVLGVELSDGLSAWKRSVRRPGWERLLERVQAGESDGIMVWHTDRLFRQPRDLEALIELGDRGFLVASAHGARDLSDPDDRFILRIEVAHAARSSDDTSRRLKRRFQTLRANGQRTGGPRPFGMPGRVILPKAQREVLEAAGQERPFVSEEQVARERQAIADASAARLAGCPGVRSRGSGTLRGCGHRAGMCGRRTRCGARWTVVPERASAQVDTDGGITILEFPDPRMFSPMVFARYPGGVVAEIEPRVVAQAQRRFDAVLAAALPEPDSAQFIEQLTTELYPQ